jgi:hypothetical protein
LDAHQPEIKKDVLADGDEVVAAADPGLDNTSMMSPKRPHRPALMPGPGTL